MYSDDENTSCLRNNTGELSQLIRTHICVYRYIFILHYAVS